MARSSRRLGANMPGVSRKTSCASPSVATPRTSMRVVCTFGETMVTLAPTSALMSVDLPTLGAPISAMKPQRRPGGVPVAVSAIEALPLDALAGQHGGGCGLLGGAFGAADPFRRRSVGQLAVDPEFGIVAGTLAFDLTISG